MSEIGSRLRRLREGVGEDQASFAARGGVSRNSQSNYERGEKSPDTDYLTKLQESGIDVASLFTGSVSSDSLADNESALIKALRSLPDRQKLALVSLLEAFCPESADHLNKN